MRCRSVNELEPFVFHDAEIVTISIANQDMERTFDRAVVSWDAFNGKALYVGSPAPPWSDSPA